MAEPMKEVSKKRYVRGRSEDNKYLKEDAGISVQKINKARKYGQYKEIIFRSFVINEIFGPSIPYLLEEIIMRHFRRS